MLRRFFLLFSSLLIIIYSSSAQDTTQAAQDTIQRGKSFTFYHNEKSFDQGTYSPLDTSLDSYHYFPPGFAQNLMTLGFTGSPAQSMYYRNPQLIGFNSGISFMDVYTSKKEEIQYFNTRKPYSKIFFLMGSKEEQILKAKHTQNIGNSFNFGLDYTNITASGFYSRQKTRSNDFHVHSSYQTKNKIYGNFANFAYSKITVDENGGLLYDFYFEEFIIDRKDAIPVSLQNASNLYKKKSWYFKQYLNFGKRENIFDAKDSINRKVVSPLLRVAHTFSFEKQISSFRDASPDSMLYLPLFNYDRTRDPLDTIKDSLNIKIYENTFSLSTVDFTDLLGAHSGYKNFYSSVFIKHQNIDRLTHNDNYDTSFQNLIAGVDLNFRFLKLFSGGGKATQVINGFNKNDHYYSGFLEFRPGFKQRDSIPGSGEHFIRIETFHQINHPDWIYSHYFSDQLQWQNDFQIISHSGQSISYHNEKWKLKAGLSQNFVKNPVYIEHADVFTVDTIFKGKLLFPRQYDGRIGINQAYLSKHVRLWKFNLNTKIYYQQSPFSLILSYPEFITYNSLYFQSLMLRKAVFGQIGVDFYYHTNYYANAYSPFLKQFYAQDKKVVGNYPFLDFFINIKIKTVRAFFKVTHLNSGLFGNTYYIVPHYPQADRTFRFGIDWRFLD